MSFQAIAWVMEHSRARGTARMVLLCIASCANQEGKNAWPSRERLARDAGVSESSVKRAIRELELLPEVRVWPRTDDATGRSKSNCYEILMGGGQDDPPGNRIDRGEGVIAATPREGVNLTPKPVREEQPEITELLSATDYTDPSITAANGRHRARPSAMVEAWNTQRHRLQPKAVAMSAARTHQLRAAAEAIGAAAPAGDALEVWRRMVQLFAADPFLNGTQAGAVKAYGIDTLLRHRGKWLDAALTSPKAEEWVDTDPAWFGR